MKMNEVFTLPIAQNQSRHFKHVVYSEESDGVVFSCHSDQIAKYACHAINNHDRLTEENATLTRERDFLAETIDQLSDHVSEAELDASSISVKFDKLTEENTKLREMLESLVYESEHGFGYVDINDTKQLLNQLKEQNNDK